MREETNQVKLERDVRVTILRAERTNARGCPRALAFPARLECAVLPPRKSGTLGPDISVIEVGRTNARDDPRAFAFPARPKRAVLPPRKNGASDRTPVTAGCSPRGWCRAAVRQGLSLRWRPTSGCRLA